MDGYLQAAESFSGGGGEVAIGLHGVAGLVVRRISCRFCQIELISDHDASELCCWRSAREGVGFLVGCLRMPVICVRSRVARSESG